MTEYRTPDEQAAEDAHDARVRAVLDEAAATGAMLLAAMKLDEPADVVEGWVDRFWNHLRAELRDDRPSAGGMRIEDRLNAIVILLQDRVSAEADRIVAGLREDA